MRCQDLHRCFRQADDPLTAQIVHASLTDPTRAREFLLPERGPQDSAQQSPESPVGNAGGHIVVSLRHPMFSIFTAPLCRGGYPVGRVRLGEARYTTPYEHYGIWRAALYGWWTRVGPQPRAAIIRSQMSCMFVMNSRGSR